MNNPNSVFEEVKALEVFSKAFDNQSYIPFKYTCDGHNINPPLRINKIPAATKSLALIVDDPDASGRTWVHWIVWNIPPTGYIEELSVPGNEGLNDFKKHHYCGPCPPSFTHRYFFKVYALNDFLELSPASNKSDLEEAMKTHIIGYGELVGLYKREV